MRGTKNQPDRTCAAAHHVETLPVICLATKRVQGSLRTAAFEHAHEGQPVFRRETRQNLRIHTKLRFRGRLLLLPGGRLLTLLEELFGRLKTKQEILLFSLLLVVLRQNVVSLLQLLLLVLRQEGGAQHGIFLFPLLLTWLLAGTRKEEAGDVKREKLAANRESANELPVNELKVGSPMPPPIMRLERETDGIVPSLVGLIDPIRVIPIKGSTAVGVLPLRLLSS
jgi:hypothetical protein